MQVDFSMHILYANSTTPNAPFLKRSGYYSPDCDSITMFPLPKAGAVEGGQGYQCRDNGDCHLLVVATDQNKIYESYSSNLNTNGQLQSLCAAVWDMCAVYPENGRGDQCTSTDAAGFPVSQLLFTADEVQSGEIDHAIRFILPNARMRRGMYVHPATHAGGPSGPSPAPIYGARLRLKSTFDISRLTASARVVAHAMQKYGMLLADGGNVALTAQNDTYTSAKWGALGFDSHSLGIIQVTDFDVVNGGQRITLTDDCVRTNIKC